MADITFGSLQEINGGAAVGNEIKVCCLDSTHIAVFYQQQSTNIGFLVVGTLSAGTITYGTPVEYHPSSTVSSNLAIETIDSTHFMVACNNNDGGNHGEVCIASVSGTTITLGSPVTVISAVMSKNQMTLLSSSQMALIYANSGDSARGYTVIVGISGTTATVNTPVRVVTEGMGAGSVSTIDSTHYLIGYETSTGVAGFVVTANVSGTTITYNTPVVLHGAVSGDAVSVAMLTATDFIVTYNLGGIGNGANTGVLDGSYAITLGSPTVNGDDRILECSVRISNTQAMVAFRFSDAFGWVLTDTSNSISVGTPVTANTNGPSSLSIDRFSSLLYAIGLHQNSNDHSGVVIGTLPTPSAIKTIDGVDVANVKTVDGLAIASMKTFNGLT